MKNGQKNNPPEPDAVSPDTEPRFRVKSAQERLAFLSQASRLLGSMLKEDVILQLLPTLCISQMADGCIVDLPQPNGSLRRFIAAHEERAWQQPRAWPKPTGPSGWARVLYSGETLLHEDLNSFPHAEESAAQEYLNLLHRLGGRSCLSVPVRGPRGVMGMLSLIRSLPRMYGAGDLAVAEDLGDHLGIALANAQLYQKAREELARRERLEQALRRAHERSQGILESITDGFLTVDRRGRLVYLNRQAEEITGKTRQAMIGRPIAREMPELLHAIDARKYQEALRRRHTLRCEEFYAPLDRWFAVRAYPTADGLSVYFEDITEHKQAERRLRSSLEEKERLLKEKDLLLKEIHHRVKNNLQVISSLLSLQADAIDDERVAGYLQDSQNRIRSMALVHEKLYGTEHFSTIEMRSYIEQMIAHLRRSIVPHDQIRVSVQAQDIYLGVDAAIPCGLLLNELVSNALKHAFAGRREGTVRIELYRIENGERLQLSVQDDGIGLPAGIEPGRTESLGLRLVEALSQQLLGMIRVHRTGGTKIAVSFPAPQESANRPAAESA